MWQMISMKITTAYVSILCCIQGSYRPWKVLESPGIKMLRFPGLESPGKRHRSWKILEKSWNSEVVVLEILISGTSIANLRRNSL